MAVATVNATPMMATNGQQADPDTKMADVPAVIPKVRKFKASELPLPSATRSAIEDLAHAFKKKGGYDETRKTVWDTFEASVCDILRTTPSTLQRTLTHGSLLYRNIAIKSRKPSLKSLKLKWNGTPPNC